MLRRRLDEPEFVRQYEAAARTLWCIAAAVTGRRDEADDIVQDAALIAFSKREQFEVGTSFTAWMGRIVRHVALNHARKRRRRAAHASIVARLPMPDPSTHSSSAHPHTSLGALRSDQEAFDDRVTDILMRLDETARACLLLRTVEELPYREIARALDIPEGTAMSHVHRSRGTLRKELLAGSAATSEEPR